MMLQLVHADGTSVAKQPTHQDVLPMMPIVLKTGEGHPECYAPRAAC
eukprot:CAMPEP_0172748104 /NCGR_PEP_ID=MMETSP1074-20121228/144297_1 /TAXON_ID=2916 /ORGANISM="Ceratium fusus, Strain PA161109" /LENGTH=46 /DNA_ID= /DNA_START= /DNA_END= /DNA_ORIENTATION=